MGTVDPLHIRPRFTLVSQESVEDLHAKFKAALTDPTSPLEGKLRLGYINLYPKAQDHHYWSPHLSITVEPDEDHHKMTVLRGLYGPSPAVWTMFVFIYAIIALIIVIVTVIGFANRSIGESSAILWALPILLLIFFSIYLTSYYGQRKGHRQIEQIDTWFQEVLKA